MKTLLLFPLLFLLCVMLSAGAQTNVKIYESERGLFFVLMPGDNRLEKYANDGFAGNGQVNSSDQSGAYEVSYTYSCADLTKPAVVDDLILGIQKRFKARKDFSIISEKATESEFALPRSQPES